MTGETIIVDIIFGGVNFSILAKGLFYSLVLHDQTFEIKKSNRLFWIFYVEFLFFWDFLIYKKLSFLFKPLSYKVQITIRGI